MPKYEPVTCPVCRHTTKVVGSKIHIWSFSCTSKTCSCARCRIDLDSSGRVEAIKKFNKSLSSR